MEFDDILLDVGDYGKYQLLILFCFIFPICFFAGIQSFIQLFLSAAPRNYVCHVPTFNTMNKSELLAAVIPTVAAFNQPNNKDAGPVYSRCHMYALNYTNPDAIPYQLQMLTTNISLREIPCQYGWEYDFETSSVVTTWNLVCDRDWYPTLALVCFTLGSVCGLMILGAMSDLLGRKLTIFTCIAVQSLFGIMSAFAPNFALWCTSRFFLGLTVPSSLRISVIFAIELVRPEKRTRVGILASGSYTVGTIVLAGLAWSIPDWRRLSLTCGLPEVVLLLMWYFVPESPRWLLAKHKSVEIKDFLRFTAKINRKILGSNTLNKLDLILDHESTTHNGQPSGTFCDLFRLPNLRKKTFLITFIWFSNLSVYMGLSFYSPNLGGSSLYLSYLLSMITEIPAYLAVWYLTETFGRRLPLFISMLAGGVLCVVTVALPENNPDAILAMYLLGKFCISASFFVVCIYAGELYPTIVRGIGLGTSATIATLGVALGPVVIHWGKDYMTLPLVIFGIFAILGGFGSLFLPETWHQKLPETLAEGEEFGKDTTFFNLFKLGGDQQLQKRTDGKDAVNLAAKKGPLVVKETVDNEDEELAFERKAHLRSFPPSVAPKKPALRLNSSTYLMTKQDAPSYS